MRKISKYLWFAILSLVAGIMGYLVFSGNIRLFLSATLLPSVYVGFGLLVFLWVYYVIQMFNPYQSYPQVFKLYHAVFLIPIVLFFTATPSITTAGLLPNHNITLTYDNVADSASPASPFQPAAVSSAIDQSFVKAVEFETDAAPCTVSDKVSESRTEDAFDQMVGLATNVLKDHEVTVIGFVSKDASYPEDTFLLSRLKIACCIADAILVGYHVKVDDASLLEKGQWVEVTGTITAVPATLDGVSVIMPVITHGTVTPVNPLPLEKAYVFTNRFRISF